VSFQVVLEFFQGKALNAGTGRLAGELVLGPGVIDDLKVVAGTGKKLSPSGGA
jgi:hypothetical protein